MREAISEWRKAAVLWLLDKHGKPMSAAELADMFVSMCMAEGYADKLWRSVDPSTMHGILVMLENRGMVKKDGAKAHARAGRASPTWVTTASYAAASLLHPPEVDQPTKTSSATVAAEPTATIAKPEKATVVDVMLEGFDELAGIVARHRSEIDAYTQRYRIKLQDANG